MQNGGLYKSTFVGRERELRRLCRAFDEAVSGHGSFATVVGEPGMGKTALCRQLADYVNGSDGLAIFGHCFEDLTLAPPYAPFLEALDACSRSSSASEAAGLLDRLTSAPNQETGSLAGTSAWLLVHAVCSFFVNVAVQQPVLLILEDLHRADRGSLDVLQQLVRMIDSASLMVVGTYRDHEVNRVHPLGNALAELRRHAAFPRLQLPGLDTEEVLGMYQQLSGKEIPRAHAALIQRQTEGNPLFVEEVLRYLVETGVEIRRDTLRDSQTLLPEGLRDVIGRRLSQLTVDTNRVLEVAAVIGRDFNVQVLKEALRSLGGPDEHEIEAALEEAKNHAVVEPAKGHLDGGDFRFTHSFFRETLYAELFTTRRIQIHRCVGTVLERHPRRDRTRIAELAVHFAHSSDGSDLTKAVEYNRSAAEQAHAVFAYSDAAGYMQRALNAQEILDPTNGESRFDLLLSLGDALVAAGEPRRVLESIAPEAFQLAKSRDDLEAATRACRLAIEALYAVGAGWIWATKEASDWAVLADRYAPGGTLLRVSADTVRARVLGLTSRPTEARALLEPALELARKLGDHDSEWDVLVCLMGANLGADRASKNLSIARELANLSRQGVSLRVLRQALHYMTHAFLEAGMRDEAETAIRDLRLLAEQTKQPNIELLALKASSIVDILDGRLDEAEAKSKQLFQFGDELGLGEYTRGIGPATYSRVALLLGHYAELKILADGDPLSEAVAALGQGELMARQQTKRAFDWYLSRTDDTLPYDDSGDGLIIDMSILSLALHTGENAVLRRLLQSYPVQGAVTSGSLGGYFSLGLISRMVGDACLQLGDLEAARGHYARALCEAEDMDYRPEYALATLGMADVLSRNSATRSEAKQLVDVAMAQLRKMKMQPALERASSIRSSLQGVRARDRKPDLLSEREVEVLKLVAEGKSSRQIAEELVLSFHTVNRHVANILAKTGSSTRAEAIAFAARQALIND